MESRGVVVVGVVALRELGGGDGVLGKTGKVLGYGSLVLDTG